MISYFNAPFLYWELCNNHKELKSIILPEIKNDYEVNREFYKKNNVWDCNCTSSFHNGEEKDLVSEFIFEKTSFVNDIFLAYNNMLKQLYDDGSITDYDQQRFSDCYVQDIWYNYYEVGENQDLHEHFPNAFSGIYLLDLSGDVNNTVWYNGSSNFPCDSRSTFNQILSKHYDITEGNIIIFPSRLPHHVPPTKNKKITISFNIRLNE